MAQTVEEMIATWHGLNLYLLNADEALAGQMLAAEKKGRARWRMMKRIHSRINKLRADRERAELQKLAFDKLSKSKPKETAEPAPEEPAKPAPKARAKK